MENINYRIFSRTLSVIVAVSIIAANCSTTMVFAEGVENEPEHTEAPVSESVDTPTQETPGDNEPPGDGQSNEASPSDDSQDTDSPEDNGNKDTSTEEELPPIPDEPQGVGNGETPQTGEEKKEPTKRQDRVLVKGELVALNQLEGTYVTNEQELQEALESGATVINVVANGEDFLLTQTVTLSGSVQIRAVNPVAFEQTYIWVYEDEGNLDDDAPVEQDLDGEPANGDGDELSDADAEDAVPDTDTDNIDNTEQSVSAAEESETEPTTQAVEETESASEPDDVDSPDTPEGAPANEDNTGTDLLNEENEQAEIPEELPEDSLLLTKNMTPASGEVPTPQVTFTVEGNFRHFQLTDSGTYQFEGITLDGAKVGGGIYVSAADVTLENAVIQNCKATLGGGVQADKENLTLKNCVIENNNASRNGGGVYSTGKVTLDGGFVSGNDVGTKDTTVLAELLVVEYPSTTSATDFLGGGIFAGSFEMLDGEISGNEAPVSGGGVYSAGDVVIRSGTIKDNIAHCVRTTTSPISVGMWYSQGGGGVYAKGTLTLVDGIVSGNTAYVSGGGLYSEKHLEIQGGQILNNKAHGRSNVTSGSPNRISDDKGGGGAFSQSTMTITGGKISGNRVEGLDGQYASYTLWGGGVYAFRDMTIRGSKDNPVVISDNVSAVNGGGIASNAFLDAEYLLLEGNTATNGTGGGAFNVYGSSTYKNSVIKDNTAGVGSGGFHQTNKTNYSHLTQPTEYTLSMVNVEVRGNEAKSGYGGGFTSFGGATFIEGCFIEENTSFGNGGGFHAQNYDKTTLSVKNTTVSNNTSRSSGGGVSYVNNFDATFDNVKFIGNSAGNGGGLAHTADTYLSTDTTIVNCLFTDNKATSNGGGFYSGAYRESNITLSNSQFYRNRAGVTGGAVSVGNYAYSGSDNGGLVKLSHVTMGGSAENANIVGSVGSTTSIGGGALNVFQYGSSASDDHPRNVVIQNSTITHNKALGTRTQGGGARICILGTATIENSTIDSNTAGQYGGGLYVSRGSGSVNNSSPSLVIKDSAVSENAAAMYGGGLYTTLPTTLESTKVNDNTVETSGSTALGGGIYSRATTLDILGGQVSGNKLISAKTSTNQGGGIYTESTSSVLTVAKDASIDNNSANNGGGIYSKGKVILKDTAKVVGNRAAVNGGGINANYADVSAEKDTKLGGNGEDANVAEKAYVIKDTDVDTHNINILTKGFSVTQYAYNNYDIYYTSSKVFTPYNISVNTVGQGSASASSTSAYPGTTIELKAVPAEEFRFISWTVDAGSASITLEDSNSATTSFVMPEGAVSVTANFEAIRYPVTVENVPALGIGTATPNLAAKGETVTLSANVANALYEFAGWEVVDGNAVIQNPESSTDASFVMPGNAVTVRPTYRPRTFSITVEYGTGGTAQASESAALGGKEIALTATPAEGYLFDHWEVVDPRNLILDSVTDATISFMMPFAHVKVRAHFKPVYNVTVESGEGGTGSASATTATFRQSIQLTATPSPGYKFDRWVPVEPEYLNIANPEQAGEAYFTMPEQSVTVRATFTRETGGGDGGGGDNGGGDPYEPDVNTTGPDVSTAIPESETPLATVPDIEIVDPDVPLGNLPTTGGNHKNRTGHSVLIADLLQLGDSGKKEAEETEV